MSQVYDNRSGREIRYCAMAVRWLGRSECESRIRGDVVLRREVREVLLRQSVAARLGLSGRYVIKVRPLCDVPLPAYPRLNT